MKKRPYIGTKRDKAGHVPTRPDPISYPLLTRDNLGVKRCLAFTPNVPLGDEGQDNRSTVEKKPQRKPHTPKLSRAARLSMLVVGMKP